MSRLTKISTFEPDDKWDPPKYSPICAFFKEPSAEYPKCDACPLDSGDICVWMEDKVGITETDHIYLRAKELE